MKRAAIACCGAALVTALSTSMIPATASPAADPLTLVSPPTIGVLPMVGEQVTLKSLGTWSPAVDENDVLKVEWLRGGAVAKTDATIFGGLELKPADTGKTIVVRVTVQDADQTYAATPGESKPLTVFARPAISGEPKVGRALKVGGWPTYVKAQVSWSRGQMPIAGAKNATYQPVAADRGKMITATVKLTATGFAGVTAVTLPRKIR